MSPVDILILTVFSAGYGLIAMEKGLKLNKAATALLTGVLCWTVAVLSSPDRAKSLEELVLHVGDTAGILFFLIGAMTIVELIDLHGGFNAVTDRITTRDKRALLWVITWLSFFLSAVLDNLTTTIVVLSLLMRLLADRNDRLLFAGIVVIAVNAGGAWSPIGDVTTTMLWIADRISAWKIIAVAFLPSVLCLLVPLLVITPSVTGTLPSLKRRATLSRKDVIARNVVLATGIAVLLLTPVFKTLTHLPPFMGILLGLAVLWIVTLVLSKGREPEPDDPKSVVTALQRIDMESILFFLGILLAVSALQAEGLLARFGQALDATIGRMDLIALLIGAVSAVVDNVPLVAAAIGMYGPPALGTDHPFWIFLAYCAGTGGSLLIIGSAAGVIAMGMAKIDFFWYLRRIGPLALLGYASGAGIFLLQQLVFK
jgi:Na+/H+ antiporter NhaD/arsenite permease-like protein